MSIIAPPNRPDLAYQLPADSYYQLIHTLRRTLPPPLTDSPEDLTRRDHAAIARIAALHPASATEADVAALYVAASEQWKDCLRLVQQPEMSEPWVMKCRAQANAMMRQAQSALRLLLRMQATRQATEADREACDRAAWTEHCSIGLMAEALSPRATSLAIADPPPPDPQPEPEPPAQPPAAPLAAAVPQPPPALLAAAVPLAAAEPLAEAQPLAEAEQYAAIYPERAAMIRRIGRVPDNVSFGPPDDDLVQALLTARGPAFAALDRRFAEAPTAHRDVHLPPGGPGLLQSRPRSPHDAQRARDRSPAILLS